MNAVQALESPQALAITEKRIRDLFEMPVSPQERVKLHLLCKNTPGQQEFTITPVVK